MKSFFSKIHPFLFFLLLLPTLAWSEIIHISSIQDVQRHTQDNSLVIFDLDNTIFEPTQELGNDQWFRHRVRDYRNTGLDREISIEKALVEWLSIQGVTEMKLVESHSAPLIANLQDCGINVMGLTTRGLEVNIQTLHQLDNLGVYFHHTSPLPHRQEFVFMNGEKGALYRNGVLFTSGTHKGSALFHLLDHAKYTPKHIIFVNDKESQLQEIEQVCQDKAIPFKGLRYSFLDEKVETYNHSVAIKQFEHFGKILSDDHAKNLLRKKSHSDF